MLLYVASSSPTPVLAEFGSGAINEFQNVSFDMSPSVMSSYALNEGLNPVVEVNCDSSPLLLTSAYALGQLAICPAVSCAELYA